ncbi:uncharacterized protein SAMN05443668_101184 [Cryptosporangium aurantiacum]|uniref:Radical SAM core domain-containing protein n=2 Tax=Cryptosporangium aurantiacum TaxID=134849 RepID=A0A1M7HGV7_9ACTN|nr:uncharacterized protein SAMN05443668_101184 [Cryptosporangium aurantiacum]
MALVLHGGEPLLGGTDYVESAITAIRRGLGPIQADLLLQTNGVLLTASIADRLIDAGLSIGISLDGNQAANDLNRTFSNGRSSYHAVLGAVRLMSTTARVESFAGILCTVQIAIPPLEVWRSLLDTGSPSIDFLLPHGTWEAPPPGLPSDGSTPYADWLIAIFDEWFDAAVRPVRVRMFEDLLDLVLGGPGGHEGFGLQPFPAVVIETDGSYEQADSLKAAFERAAQTGLAVPEHSIDDYLAQPGVIARQIGSAALAHACRECDVVRICGGGMYAHRYRRGSGFRNPSVYCANLFALVRHIQRRVATALEERGTSLAEVTLRHNC